MQDIQLHKFKISVLLLICLFLSYFGWSVVRPENAELPMSIMLHTQPVIVFSIAVILVIAGGIIGRFFGKIGQQSIGMVGVPAALCWWIMASGDLADILPGTASLEQRADLFQHFAIDALLWGLLLGIGFLLTKFISRETDPDANPVKQQGDPKAKTSLMENPIVSNLAGLIVSCLIAFILLKILMQSEKTWTEEALRLPVSRIPEKKQALFAVFIAFFLGTLISKTVFKVSVNVLLCAPLLLSFFGYLFVAQHQLPQEILERAPEMVLPSTRFVLLMPLQFLGSGSLAVVFGYWSRVHASDLSPV